MHGCTAKGPLNTSLATTTLRTGTRLLAAILPLALLVIVRLTPGAITPEQGASLRAGMSAAAAIAAGAAFLVTAGSALRDRRLVTLLNAAALGVLGGTFAFAALHAVGTSGIAIGMALSGLALASRSVSGDMTVGGKRAPGGAAVALFVAVEASLIIVLLGAPMVAVGGSSSAVLASAAVLLAIAMVSAVRADDQQAQVVALLLGASGALALAFAQPTPAEPVIGVAAVSLAAVLLGWSAATSATRWLGSGPRVPTLRLPVADDDRSEPELSEAARLVRELRGTLDELMAARRTVELQRGEIERATRLDATTGVTGRAAILDRLRIEAAEARRYSHPLAVVLLDLDGFDDLNRRFGFEAGDAILREVALRLRLRVREADALGRIGDDAFLAILPHTDEAGAATFADVFRQRLIERPLAIGGEEISLAVSIGIALVRPGIELGPDDLLNAATEALASAKAAGGNRIAFDRLHGLARLEERRGTPRKSETERAEDTR